MTRTILLFLIALLILNFAQCAAAQTTPSIHPYSHPFNTPEELKVYKERTFRFPLPPPVAAKGADWERASAGVNAINCAASFGDETWLATDYGVKMVDKKTKVVTHYTRTEGLPGDKTLAISADADGATCIQERLDKVAAHADFCEYDRSSGQWRTLGEASCDLRKLSGLSSNKDRSFEYVHFDKVLTSLSEERALFVVSPVVRDAKDLAYCYDRRTGEREAIPFDDGIRKGYPSLEISWASVDNAGAWLGTSRGLLRWTFADKTWKTWLSDRKIVSGAKAEDGVIWLAAYETMGYTPERRDAYLGGVYTRSVFTVKALGSWKLIAFNPSVNTISEVEMRIESAFQNPAIKANPQTVHSDYCVSADKNQIWITLQEDYDSHIWLSFVVYSPSEVRFNTLEKTEILSGRESRVSLNVPDSVLFTPHISQEGTIAKYFTEQRFFEWDCEEYATVNRLPDSAFWKDEEIKDAEGGIWYSQPDNVLHFVSMDKRITAQFRPTNETVREGILVYSVAIANNTLFALSNQKLYRFNETKSLWAEVPLPFPAFDYEQFEHRLRTSGKRLVIWIGSKVALYDPATELFSAISMDHAVYATPCLLDGDIFLSSNLFNKQIWRVDLAKKTTQEIPTPMLPAELTTKGYDDFYPVSICQGRIWYKALNSKLKTIVLIGYDLQSKKWTCELAISPEYRNDVSSLAYKGKTYLAVGSEGATIFVYDPEKNDLNVCANPMCSYKNEAYGMNLILVSDREIWFYTRYGTNLYLYDLKEKTTTAFPIPGELRPPYFRDSVVLKGNDLYFPTERGVFRFNRVTHLWSGLPGFPVRIATLNVLSVDLKSVWMSAYTEESNNSVIVRFDRARMRRQLYGEENGIIPIDSIDQLFSDGASGWALSWRNRLYRLPPKSNFWENLSQKLWKEGDPLILKLKASPGSMIDVSHIPPDDFEPAMPVKRIAKDDDSVWIMPGRGYPYNEAPPTASPLLRYDIASGKYSSLNPLPGKAITCHGLQVDKAGLWLICDEGIFRYTKSSRKWSKVEPPADAKKHAKFRVLKVERISDELRFFGLSESLKFKYPGELR